MTSTFQSVSHSWETLDFLKKVDFDSQPVVTLCFSLSLTYFLTPPHFPPETLLYLHFHTAQVPLIFLTDTTYNVGVERLYIVTGLIYRKPLSLFPQQVNRVRVNSHPWKERPLTRKGGNFQVKERVTCYLNECLKFSCWTPVFTQLSEKTLHIVKFSHFLPYEVLKTTDFPELNYVSVLQNQNNVQVFQNQISPNSEIYIFFNVEVLKLVLRVKKYFGQKSVHHFWLLDRIQPQRHSTGFSQTTSYIVWSKVYSSQIGKGARDVCPVVPWVYYFFGKKKKSHNGVACYQLSSRLFWLVFSYHCFKPNWLSEMLIWNSTNNVNFNLYQILRKQGSAVTMVQCFYILVSVNSRIKALTAWND